jgi:hypothetical protein
LSASVAGGHEVSGSRERTDADHRIRHGPSHCLDGGQRSRRAQCDFQYAQATSAQRARQRHGVIDVLDGEHGNDGSQRKD